MSLEIRRTGRTIKAKCCYRENTINKSHKVLPPGDKGSIATEGISYETYDKGGVLPSGKYYKRKP